MWRAGVVLAFCSLFLTGCYWHPGKGIRLPAARPLPDPGTATLTVINNDVRPLLFYRADRSEALELVIPPRSHWTIPNMQGEWWFRFTRKPVHLPRVNVMDQVQSWPAGSRMRLERKWDYTVVVDSSRVSWTMSRWVYKPTRWEWPVED